VPSTDTGSKEQFKASKPSKENSDADDQEGATPSVRTKPDGSGKNDTLDSEEVKPKPPAGKSPRLKSEKAPKTTRLGLDSLLKDTSKPTPDSGEAEEPEELTSEDALPLTEENVKSVLEKYAALLKEEGKKSLPKFVESLAFEISDDALLFKVNSKQKEGQLEEERIRLAEQFREVLKRSVRFSIVIVKEPTGPRKPYTDKEKLQHMVEKNPMVRRFTDEFGLTPE
jgi:hypothetical protein